MIVLKVVQLWSGRMYSLDDKLAREYKRRFRIVTDTAQMDGAAVYRSAAILGLVPRIHDPYLSPSTIDTGSLCKKVRPIQVEQHPRVWDMDAEYSSTVRDPGKQNEDPTLRPIDISWRSATFATTCEAAYSKRYSNDLGTEIVGPSDGEEADLPVINSARDIFVPPLQDEDRLLVVHVGKNIPSYDVDLAYDFQDSVNSEPWLGGMPETWKCISLEGTLQPIEHGIVYWRLETEFHYKYDNWRKKLQDRGRSELIDGKRRLIIDRGNNVVNGNALLDGTGKALPVGDDPVFIHYRTKRKRDFSDLRLF